MTRPGRLVFTTDWSGDASGIWLVADYGYLAWSPNVYNLWNVSWLDAYRPFREAHPEVSVLPRLRLDVLAEFGVTSKTHPGLYWQHRRWQEKALGNGLVQDTGVGATCSYNWDRSDLPAALGQYFCDVVGLLHDQRLIDGVTLCYAPDLPPRPRTLLQKLTGRGYRPDYVDLVGIQVRNRLGNATIELRARESRPWSSAWRTAYDEKAWASRESLAAFTAQAAIAGRSVLDDGLHDLRTFWPKSLSFCNPFAAPAIDLVSHTIRYMGGALAVQSNLNGKARIYWPEGERED